MWAVQNRTPYAAERNWTRDRDGVHWWVVAVRATFDVSPAGRLTLADEQLPPALAPEHLGEPGTSSLRCDSELLAVKPGTDVIVVAKAHAPQGRLARSVPVVLRVGPMEKQLIVFGDRIYERGPFGVGPSSPAKFTQRPIRYELAFGGSDLEGADPKEHRIDERNPIGRGIARRLVGTPAHAIEYPDGTAARRGPAGFGAIEAAWLPRRRFAGTYDEAWAARKKPLLPDDYDARFALSAPEDQRLPKPLVGGERVALLNMTPEGALQFEVPRVTLRFTTRFGARRDEHRGLLSTVLVETEERRVSMVWQSALRVAAPEVDYLDSTEVAEA